MRMRILLLSSFIFFVVSGTSGQLPGAWTQAEQAFRKGAYTEAAAQYEQLRKEGYAAAELYHNLGLCYARSAQWGRAVLAFERGLSLDPGSAPLRENLQLAKQELQDQIEGFEEYALIERLRNPQKLAASGAWGYAAVLAFWLALLTWLSRNWISRAIVQRMSFPFSVTLAALGGILLLIALYARKQETDWRWAIVMSLEVTVHQAPDARSPEKRLVHEGVKVYIQEILDPWAKIRLENGDEGWVEAAALESVVPLEAFGESQ